MTESKKVFNVLAKKLVMVTDKTQFFRLIIKTPLCMFSLQGHFYNPSLLCRGLSVEMIGR